LVNRVVPGAELMSTVEALMKQMLANAPLALTRILDGIRRTADAPTTAVYDLESFNFSQLAGTEDAREGAAAFLQKRTPRFGGR
jgi:enoyl-CoA hydratase